MWLVLPVHVAPPFLLPPRDKVLDHARRIFRLNIRHIDLNLIVISKPQDTTFTPITFQNLDVCQLSIRTATSTRRRQTLKILLQLAMQNRRVESSATLTKSQMSIVADTFVVLRLAIRGDEDRILELWIFHYGLQSLLTIFCAFDLVPCTTSRGASFDWVNEFVVV